MGSRLRVRRHARANSFGASARSAKTCPVNATATGRCSLRMVTAMSMPSTPRPESHAGSPRPAASIRCRPASWSTARSSPDLPIPDNLVAVDARTGSIAWRTSFPNVANTGMGDNSPTFEPKSNAIIQVAVTDEANDKSEQHRRSCRLCRRSGLGEAALANPAWARADAAGLQGQRRHDP